jgi:hypothetical protein
MKLSKLLETKSMYLQNSFMTEGMLLSQVKHTLERRNLHHKDAEELFISY